MTANLQRVRWGIRGVLVLGLAASTVANVLHADPNPISQCIAAWPVVALYLTIEVISRVPIHRRAVAVARLVATAVIAGIAAWVSYWHMAGVAARYGETGASPYLLPLSVDGLIVVASICLVELGGRIRAAGEENGESSGERQKLLPAAGGDAARSGEAEQGRSGTETAGDPSRGVREVGAPAEGAGEALTEVATVATPRKPHPSSAERVARAHKKTPEASHAELAKRLNLSARTVRQYRPKPPDETAPINGHDPELVGAGHNEKEN